MVRVKGEFFFLKERDLEETGMALGAHPENKENQEP